MEKKKIKLDIIGLSYSQTQSGAYALVLGEAEGKRRLPIIIGGPEAQSIAIELEKMQPTRPLTHDLFKSFSEAFHINVIEVVIYNLVEGIFYANLVCRNEAGDVQEIDSRTSDAIALATRFNCPVYTYEFILSSAGIIMEEGGAFAETAQAEKKTPKAGKGDKYSELTNEELQTMLNEAIEEEAYEKAGRIKQELDKRQQS